MDGHGRLPARRRPDAVRPLPRRALRHPDRRPRRRCRSPSCCAPPGAATRRGRRRDPRRHQRRRRGQPQRGADGGAAGRAAGTRARRDRQPALRLRRRGDRPGGAGGRGRRRRARHRRRRREHEPGAVRAARSRTCRSRPRRSCGTPQVGWRMVNPRVPARSGRSARCVRRGGRRRARHRPRRAGRVGAALATSGRRRPGTRGCTTTTCCRWPATSSSATSRSGPTRRSARLAALKPAFTADGTVTAGNSSPVNDGAIAVPGRVAREAAASWARRCWARSWPAPPSAVEPHRFSVAPGAGDPQGAGPGRADRRRHRRLGDQRGVRRDGAVLPARASPRSTGERVNPHGGAIAIGHPLGASAPRVIVDLCRELRRRGGGIGVAAACIGVGQGTAVVVRVDG